MSFTIMKYKAWEALAKKQAKIDEVLVFEEDFSSISRQLVQAQAECDVWLTWVDFAPTYRFEMSNQTLRLIGYDEVVAKANHWLARHATSSTSNSSSSNSHHPTLIHWSVLNCETLYAKILINFAENGDIKGKRVAAISKWPLQEENCLNNFDPNQALSKQNATNVLDGRYIVQLLRLWLVRSRDPAEALEYHRSSKHGGGGSGGPPPPRIGYRDYWPKMLPAKEGSRESSKGAKKVLEKMQEVTDRINLDIASGEVFTGPLLNVTTFPCYSTSGDNQRQMPSVDDGSELLKADQVINVVRVFFDASVDARQEDLVGFADFIPECISGGGFIKYPKFETQSRLVAKASRWLAANPEIRFLNSSSVDIKLRSMTSIDSSEMAFVRNTGDFIRILRICYTKPFESDDSTLEIVDLSRNPGPSTSYSHHSRSRQSQPPPPPPPAPIYLNVRNLFSSKNSTTELKGKLYEFLREPAFSPSATDTAHRWRILTAESLGIWGSSNKKGDDLWETSFHALSISSSSMMNRNAFDGVNVFYDTGYFGKTQEENNSPPAGGNNPDDEEPEEARKKQALVPRSKGIPCSVL